jgi:putative tricarboxylic transport membrane protein
MNDRGPGQPAGSLLGPRIIAAILVLGGAFLISESFRIGQATGYSVVGPSAVPLVVCLGLVFLGILFALRTTVRPDVDYAVETAEQERATHWPTVGLMLVALVVYAFALNGFRVGSIVVPGLGYVLATGLFLPVAARILGSWQLLRDLLVGFALAVVIYVAFTQFLTVRLPPDPFGLLR